MGIRSESKVRSELTRWRRVGRGAGLLVAVVPS
jgi:hypothetical protein